MYWCVRSCQFSLFLPPPLSPTESGLGNLSSVWRMWHKTCQFSGPLGNLSWTSSGSLYAQVLRDLGIASLVVHQLRALTYVIASQASVLIPWRLCKPFKKALYDETIPWVSACLFAHWLYNVTLVLWFLMFPEGYIIDLVQLNGGGHVDSAMSQPPDLGMMSQSPGILLWLVLSKWEFGCCVLTGSWLHKPRQLICIRQGGVLLRWCTLGFLLEARHFSLWLTPSFAIIFQGCGIFCVLCELAYIFSSLLCKSGLYHICFSTGVVIWSA